MVSRKDSAASSVVLVYTQANGNLGKIAAWLLRSNMLQLIDTVIQQDADILAKIYPDAPQKIKLNNEIGMDWVQRNFQAFPEVLEPNLSTAPGKNNRLIKEIP
jgi:hypothetical protein